MTDPDRLAQIAANLTENALRYTPEAGRVSFTVQPHAGGVQLDIADTGPGIDAGDLSRVFEKFYVARKYRRRTPRGVGTGTGHRQATRRRARGNRFRAIGCRERNPLHRFASGPDGFRPLIHVFALRCPRAVPDHCRRPTPSTRVAAAGGRTRGRRGRQRPARDFLGALAGPGLSVIAEVKRASPSRGVIDADLDPIALAVEYGQGGAAAISVLTEPLHFQGSLDDLRRVSRAVDVPVLRKDFLIDPVQIWEARASGADAVLLIVAVLDDATLTELLALTHAIGMESLVEVHTADEVERARAAGRE